MTPEEHHAEAERWLTRAERCYHKVSGGTSEASAAAAIAAVHEAMSQRPCARRRVMLREYADAVAPAVLRWAGDQIRAEAAQLEERDGAGYSYAYGFGDAADFIDPTTEGKTDA